MSAILITSALVGRAKPHSRLPRRLCPLGVKGGTRASSLVRPTFSHEQTFTMASLHFAEVPGAVIPDALRTAQANSNRPQPLSAPGSASTEALPGAGPAPQEALLSCTATA